MDFTVLVFLLYYYLEQVCMVPHALLPLQVPGSVRMVSSAVTMGNAYQPSGNVIILLTAVSMAQMKPIVCY